MNDRGQGSVQPSGAGSLGGGGGPPRANNAAGNSAGVTNQTLLALDPSIHANIPPHRREVLNKIQLAFARDVSARAAQAYQETLDALDDSSGSPVSVD